MGTRIFFTSINFPGGRKNLKIAIFGLHYIKVSSFFMPMQWTYKFFMNSQIVFQANCKDHVKFHRNPLIRGTSKLSLKNCFFAIFLVRSWFLRSMCAVAQNWLIPQKFHKNQNCKVSKSKIIMCLWFLALKARKAGNRPRTFYTGLTVFYIKTRQQCISWNISLSCVITK